jgi:hypothetical protein
MSQTPIFDQLRGEQISADLPASATDGTDPQRGTPRGRHHLLADVSGAGASGAGGAVWMLLERAKAVASGGIRARRAPAHAVEAPAHALNEPPAPASPHAPTAQPGAPAGPGDTPPAGSPERPGDRFSWFDVAGEARC